MTETPPNTSQSQAIVTTPKASRYLQQFCKHFSHKLPVTFDKAVGHVPFDGGDCDLAAEGDKLTLTLTGADTARMVQLQDVVARHLQRFAFREELAVEWHAI
jgi:hypothetical protein